MGSVPSSVGSILCLIVDWMANGLCLLGGLVGLALGRFDCVERCCEHGASVLADGGGGGSEMQYHLRVMIATIGTMD
eukprot:COSAG01_NODE_6804_length_3492_cov_2.270557_2_plen_77_part_00